MTKPLRLATTGGGGIPQYIEDVFSTYLWAGNSSSQSINIGFNLTTSTAMTWFKDRTNADGAGIVNTVQGNTQRVVSYATDAGSDASSYFGFTSTGYNFPSSTINTTGSNYVGWTFRKAPKFFDVVTYTGNGSNRTIAHNLGSVPGCIIVKRTDTAADWQVYHRSLANTEYMVLNTTAAVATGATRWNSTTPTSTVFSLGTDTTVNANGGTYVALLFAHDAGGFGLSGNENVISCGSFTTDGSGNATVTLNYEPQFVMMKRTDGAGDWFMLDNMRGWDLTSSDKELYANSGNGENNNQRGHPTATGFQVSNFASNIGPFIYIAIRRGPMRVPTDATKVYNAVNTTSPTGHSVGFPPDFAITRAQNVSQDNYSGSRLQGGGAYLKTNTTDAETSLANAFYWGQQNTAGNSIWGGGTQEINWYFRRAPGVHDQICYNGTGANKTESFTTLGVQPELWLIKRLNGTGSWTFGSTLLNNTEKIVTPSPNGRVTDATAWNSTFPTASLLSLGTQADVNASGGTFTAFMWASTPGVSKVISYTGNGSTQTINCGFTTGARFVMIIRATASTAQDIFLWDSARGIVSGNDSRLSLNTTAAEVTTLDSIDPDNSGFVVNQDSSNINVNGAVYIALAYA